MSDLRTWDAWRRVHQVFELKWWQDALANGHEGLSAQYEETLKFINPTGLVLDIGCGPRPAFPPCTVIEPLADEYRKFTPPEWWEHVTAYACPAETIVPGVKADTIICWNCLNHSIGWRIILDNMLAYANPGAHFAVSTDFDPPFTGHPGYEEDLFRAELDKRFTVTDQRTDLGFALAVTMTAK